MLVKLKHILDTYTDKELEDTDLWVNSSFKIETIIIDDYSIDLIGENMQAVIKSEKEIVENLTHKEKN